MPRDRVAAILIQDDAVALIERRRGQDLYYLFPGGRVEGTETLQDALAREIIEELGLHVEAARLVAEVSYRGSVQHYFTSRVVGGTFGTGRGAEILGPTPPEDGTYRPLWVPTSAMSGMPIYPSCVVELIMASREGGWPMTPRTFVDPGRR